MNHTLFIMIGIPGSGKSTVAAQYSNAVIISSDSIRKKMFGNESIQSRGDLVFAELRHNLVDSLRAGQSDIILDAMNLRRRDRKQYINLAKKYNYQCVAIYCDTPLEIAIEHNAQRERHVPIDVIEQKYNALQEPQKDEGFDDILIITH